MVAVEASIAGVIVIASGNEGIRDTILDEKI